MWPFIQCIFRASTHVRYGRILAANVHLKVLHATLLHHFADNAVSQRDGIRGAVCCLSLFLFPYVCYPRVEHPNQSRASCWFASNIAARGHLGRFPPFSRYVVAVSTLGWRCWELANQLCRAFQLFAFCQRFARVFLHASLFVVRTYNMPLAVPDPGTHMCRQFVWSREARGAAM